MSDAVVAEVKSMPEEWKDGRPLLLEFKGRLTVAHYVRQKYPDGPSGWMMYKSETHVPLSTNALNDIYDGLVPAYVMTIPILPSHLHEMRGDG